MRTILGTKVHIVWERGAAGFRPGAGRSAAIARLPSRKVLGIYPAKRPVRVRKTTFPSYRVEKSDIVAELRGCIGVHSREYPFDVPGLGVLAIAPINRSIEEETTCRFLSAITTSTKPSGC
jgi:hypothetical protein